MTRAAAALLAATLAGCGYHAVYGGDAERFHVVLARSLIPDAIATDEVVSGVRETLAREGALAAGDGYPRVEVEVLREDEMSEGVAAASVSLGGSLATPSGTGASAASGPRARATEVGLVARACLVRWRGGSCERDTGDVRAMDLAATDLVGGTATSGPLPALGADAFHHRDAARATGKRLGASLASHILGEPVATDEAIGRER